MEQNSSGTTNAATTQSTVTSALSSGVSAAAVTSALENVNSSQGDDNEVSQINENTASRIENKPLDSSITSGAQVCAFAFVSNTFEDKRGC